MTIVINLNFRVTMPFKILTTALFSTRNILFSCHSSKKFSTLSHPLFFRITAPAFAEPMKKKKRVDPAVAKSREDRKKKKVEKEIKKLKKNAQQLKPIEELEIAPELIEQKEIRTRPPPQHDEATLYARGDLMREWTRYRAKESQKDYKIMDRLIYAQRKALDELRVESEELYQEAIQIDPVLLPFSAKGPLATPPIENYASPDGDYTVMTRNYVKEHEERKAAMEAILNKSRKPFLKKK